MRNSLLEQAHGRGMVLRPGRTIRAVIRVSGECTLEDLELELTHRGFAPGVLLCDPTEWRRIKPSDWPDEPAIGYRPDECPVRVMGRFTGPPAAFEPDEPIGNTGASFTVESAWEYARAVGERVAAGAAAAPAHGQAQQSAKPMLFITASLLGLGWWLSHRAHAREEKMRARMFAAIARDEERVRSERVLELQESGVTREEAAAIADTELHPPEQLAAAMVAEEIT